MSGFHLSAQNIRLDDNHILRARLQNERGSWRDAEIDLNGFIGNNNGYIEWDGENFSHTAHVVEFQIKGGGQIPVLRCECRAEGGYYVASEINLSERIENEDGKFVFI